MEKLTKKLTKKSRILLFVIADITISFAIAVPIFIWFYILPEYDYKIEFISPSDELPRAVRKAAGKDFYYLGKEESDSGVTEYEYEIRTLEKGAIANLVNALNDAVENEQGKITVKVYLEDSGALCPIFSADNFSDAGLEAADYDGMYAICIRKPGDTCDLFGDSPSIYTGIEGIKKLSLNAGMKKQAEKEGIDWYELWPDLEEVEVVDW